MRRLWAKFAADAIYWPHNKRRQKTAFAARIGTVRIFVESGSADGLRQCLTEEFSRIFIFHLRGNSRTRLFFELPTKPLLEPLTGLMTGLTTGLTVGPAYDGLGAPAILVRAAQAKTVLIFVVNCGFGFLSSENPHWQVVPRRVTSWLLSYVS